MSTPKNTPDDFWRKVAVGKPDECWEWLGSHNREGYGLISWGNVTYRAHRIAYALATGATLPRERRGKTTVLVCHSCDHPWCCNPNHLWPGTQSDNMQDRDAKGRTPLGDAHHARSHPEHMARGSTHGMAKLSESDIPIIRSRLASGDRKSEIATMFGVTRQAIHHIGTGRAWRHVAPE